MQLKLHRWAREDPARCFGDLYNLVYDPAFLVDAFARVAGNQGAKTAGVDGLTVARVRLLLGEEEFLTGIGEQLRARTFCPAPTRRVQIPKANGKMRKLGIPTVADRVVQAALKAVLEPIFEADFKPCSYGFRPNRAQDAIAEIQHMTGAAPVGGEDPRGRHRRGFRVPRVRHPTTTETGNLQVLRLHGAVTQGDRFDHRPRVRRDLPIHPEPGPGPAAAAVEPDVGHTPRPWAGADQVARSRR